MNYKVLCENSDTLEDQINSFIKIKLQGKKFI